jgi:cytochrome P450
VPRPDQFSRLPLLDRVVKESLRILPPVVYTSRNSTRDFVLGGYRLPAGAKVGIGIYGAHHLPEVFERPERFHPGRWETISPGPFAYLPFGAGARLCMGMTQAVQTMKITLAATVQRFSLHLVDGSRIDRSVRITMSPRKGISLRLEEPGRAVRPGVVRGNIREMVELPG